MNTKGALILVGIMVVVAIIFILSIIHSGIIHTVIVGAIGAIIGIVFYKITKKQK